MYYDIFKDIDKDPDYRTQKHMEHTIKMLTGKKSDDVHSFNEMLAPQFESCSLEDRKLALRFKIEPWMLNPAGNVHGGIIATGCDVTMGMLLRYLRGYETGVTVALNMRYMRGLSGDDSFIVQAKADKEGRTVYFISASVYRASDRQLAATASAEFM